MHSSIPATDVSMEPYNYQRPCHRLLVWKNQRILANTKHHRQQADHKRGDMPNYKPGERVWLSTRDFKNQPGSHKLNFRFIGPYKDT